MKNLRSRKLMAAVSLFAISASITATGFAQTAPTTPTATTTDQNQVVLEKYVVTGTYLPLSADAPAIPVTTVSSQAIADSGVTTNLMDVLTKIQPQFSGSLNLGPTNGNIASNSTSGGSQLALRNFPTLVLINGHRAAFAPVDSVGGFQFVDLNLIPVAAVEKIEILTDGASAIYGSDAVGGVVNVILKTNYQGFEFGTRYGWASNLVAGHYGERSAYLTGGVSDGKTSITISAEWMKSDPLYQYQAPVSQYTTGTTNYPGVVNIGSAYYMLNPSLNAPPAGHVPIATLVANGTYSGPYTSSQIIADFNLSEKATSIIADERKSAVVAFDHTISDYLKFTGNIIYSDTDTFSQLNAQPVAIISPATDPNNPTNTSIEAHNRFVPFPRQYLADTSSVQGMGELDGKITQDLTYSLSADYNIEKQNFQNPNLVSASQLNAALASPAILDLFAITQTPAALASAAIFGTAFGYFETSLLTYDGVLKDKVFTLPSGDLDVAVGAEFRREGLSANADVNSLPATFNWDSGTTITPLTTSRTIWGEFGQITIPIVSPSMKIPGVYSLSSDDAIRHESYEYVMKKPTDPLIALRYQPFDDSLTLRASYTKSFIAPSLFNLYGPGGIGFTTDLTNFQQYNGPVIANDGQGNESSGSNPNLNPTIAENWTAGFVYSPKGIKGLTLTADYYRIRESSIVGTVSDVSALQQVELEGPASQYAQFTALGNFPGKPGSTPITAPGQIAGEPTNVYFVNTEINLGSDKYEGLDTVIDYHWEVPSVGRFDLSNKSTYNFAYWLNVPFSPGDETAGKADFTNGTTPRLRSYTALDYTNGGWNALVANTFMTALTDDDDGAHINAYISWDMALGYTFSSSDPGFLGVLKGLKLSYGINDFFNRQPSRDFDVFSTNNADIATYSPLGRFMYVQLQYKF